ncbi:MAG: DUF3576 domain-containing protein [Alphaproteobacteria bacterium]
MSPRPFRAAALVCVTLLLAACGVETQAPDVPRRDQQDARTRERYGTLFGPDALTFSTNPDRNRGDGGGGGGIGVNAFLWRASLDTLDFIPLASADPFGGVIITEWYRPPDSDGERFKLNVYITDTQLRADALNVAVFREVEDGNGGWRNAPVDAATARDLENTILTRARELRINAG